MVYTVAPAPVIYVNTFVPRKVFSKKIGGPAGSVLRRVGVVFAGIVTLPECATLRQHFWEAIVSSTLFHHISPILFTTLRQSQISDRRFMSNIKSAGPDFNSVKCKLNSRMMVIWPDSDLINFL